MSEKLLGLANCPPEVRQAIARRGGNTLSRDRKHMGEIGKLGGRAVSANREHMARIGSLGGKARVLKREACEPKPL